MAGPKRKHRNLIRWLAGLLVAALVVLAALPLWFPWVLRPILQHYGVGFSSYDRNGYNHFAVTDVRGQWENVTVEIQQFHGVLPAAWLWRAFVSQTNAAPLFAIEGADLTIEPRSPSETREPGSLDQTLDRILGIAEELERFAPVVELTNCRIVIASNIVLLPHGEWRDGRLTARIGPPQGRGEIELSGELHGSTLLQLSVAWNAYDSLLNGEFRKATNSWSFAGNAQWRTNQAAIAAQFSTNGWWPVSARLEAPHLRIPAEPLRLRSYEDLTAALILTVASKQFSVTATGVAHPDADYADSGFPAAEFTLAVAGDSESVNVRTLQVNAPWLQAELSSAVGLSWRGEITSDPARFQVLADLSKLPGVTLTGQIEGEARVAAVGPDSVVRFNLSATNVNAWNVAADSIVISGELDSPRLQLAEFKAVFADGSTLAASGALDLKSRQVEQGDWKFSGTFLNTFLRGWSYAELATAGHLRGPFTNLQHDGEATITGLQVTGLNLLNATARWAGQQLRLELVGAEVTAGVATLSVGGAVDLSAIQERQVTANLTNASLRRGEEELYALQQPSAISFTARTNFAFAVDGFDWAGANRRAVLSANVIWPTQGVVNAAFTNVSLQDFSDFLTNDYPNILVPVAAVAANWTNGPVHAAVLATGEFTNRTGQRFSFQADVTAEEAIAVKQLRVGTDYVSTLSVTGSIPVRIVPGRSEGVIAWDAAQPIELTGSLQDDEAREITLPLGKHGELTVAQPELRFKFAGPLDAPVGNLELRAGTISWRREETNTVLPRLENLQVSAELLPEQIKLNTFTAALEGQQIEASGVWPISQTAWRQLWVKKKLPDWERAQGNLDLPEARLAELARYLPSALAPEGRLSARLELKPGKELEGILLLTNAATRALGKLAPLREINARVRFNQQRATLEDFRGQIGGQPVSADGFVTIPGKQPLDYQVNLRGTNVPLARSLELLLRGDFDVQLRGGSNAPPVLAGTVRLHDGLFVQHAAARVWQGPRRPQMRPPYFSVTNAPLADWRLNLTLAGERMLRVRTPVFNGLVSANLKLRGSLRQPVLTGDTRVDSGRVMFPFGSLEVNQGYATFSGNDPQGPDLHINAAGRNYRYEIQLDVKGPVETAQVTFSSTPPLTSEQILLLLTAGEMPDTDYSFTAGARAGRLATFLGRDLLSRYLGNEGDEERLIIRSGEDVSEEGRLTYSVEYRLSERWSVIGEYDEYNAFNTDLKWKVFVR